MSCDKGGISNKYSQVIKNMYSVNDGDKSMVSHWVQVL